MAIGVVSGRAAALPPQLTRGEEDRSEPGEEGATVASWLWWATIGIGEWFKSSPSSGTAIGPAIVVED